MATKITNHIEQALERLLEQYKGKIRIEGLISALVEQIQDLEDVVFDLPEDLTIETASGIQLDLIGTIVVQDRLGFSDDVYKALLRAKIGENVSTSTPEDIIDVTKLLTGATLVHFQEYFPAGYGISINISVDPSLIDFFYRRIDRVDPAGVRLEALICFDPDEPFAFDGAPGPTLGFGDLNDANAGGKFAEIHLRENPKFSFAPSPGSIPGTDEGFGDLNDPLFGGLLI